MPRQIEPDEEIDDTEGNMPKMRKISPDGETDVEGQSSTRRVASPEDEYEEDTEGHRGAGRPPVDR